MRLYDLILRYLPRCLLNSKQKCKRDNKFRTQSLRQ